MLPFIVSRLVIAHPGDELGALGIERDDIVREARLACDQVASRGAASSGVGLDGTASSGVGLDGTALDHPAEADGNVMQFGCIEGPFTAYDRTVRKVEAGWVEEITYTAAFGWLGWIYAWPLRSQLRSPRGSAEHQRWWAPPQRLDARAASVLSLLAVASLGVGYLTTMLTQTLTYAADEFGATDGEQTRVLAWVRVGIVISLLVVGLADRKGRRRVIVALAVAAPLAGAVGALAPSMAWLAMAQALARPLALSLAMVIAIVVAEEMPKGSRAYAMSLIALMAGAGAGLCVILLPLADVSVTAWRFLLVVPLIFLIAARPLSSGLPESRRYLAPHAMNARLRDHRGRFALLAISGFCGNLLVAPASGLQNEYLSNTRGYSATFVALFTLVTQTPVAIGVFLGGELSDRYGRRVVGAVALAVGTIGTAATYGLSGAGLWMASAIGAIVGGAAVPALSVYNSELFPTAIRGRAQSAIIVVTLAGSTTGLLVAGAARDRGVDWWPLMASLSAGPLLVALAVITVFPETAHRELEDLNPEDLNPENLNPEDLNPEDLNPEDLNPEDLNPEDLNPEDLNPEDLNPEDLNPEDLKPENRSTPGVPWV
jgi:MFS family permease